MYGLVNRAIQQLVVATAGDAAWTRVCAKAQVDDVGFVAMCPYHDDVTYRLVEAVSTELGMAAEDVLVAFGEYWILYTADEGYAEMMASAGDNLREFMANLDEMHSRIALLMPSMVFPRFDVVTRDDVAFEVHYHSHRAGLTPMVLGLLRGLAKRFNESVAVRLLSARGEGRDADIFLVELAPVPA